MTRTAIYRNFFAAASLADEDHENPAILGVAGYITSARIYVHCIFKSIPCVAFEIAV